MKTIRILVGLFQSVFIAPAGAIYCFNLTGSLSGKGTTGNSCLGEVQDNLTNALKTTAFNSAAKILPRIPTIKACEFMIE